MLKRRRKAGRQTGFALHRVDVLLTAALWTLCWAVTGVATHTDRILAFLMGLGLGRVNSSEMSIMAHMTELS